MAKNSEWCYFRKKAVKGRVISVGRKGVNRIKGMLGGGRGRAQKS